MVAILWADAKQRQLRGDFAPNDDTLVVATLLQMPDLVVDHF